MIPNLSGGERRKKSRREEDELRDDALDPAILLGYEQWAGMVWRHRGKILAAFTVLSGAVGCVAGYLGRQHDLDDVKLRVTKVETAQDSLRANVRALQSTGRFQNYVLCVSVPTTAPEEARRLCKQIIDQGYNP